jgi:hypothetical protein
MENKELWNLAEKEAQEAIEDEVKAKEAEHAPEPDGILSPAEAEMIKGMQTEIAHAQRPLADAPAPDTRTPPIGRFKKVHITEDQEAAIFAEIEDLLFLSGRHRDDILWYLQKTYQVRKITAEWWIRRTTVRWRQAQEAEDLTNRHYQLERMAHALYNRAVDGPTWQEVRAKIAEAVRLADRGENAAARQLLTEFSKSKGADLKTAQRVLYNLAAFAGLGNKITLDLAGTGITIEHNTGGKM